MKELVQAWLYQVEWIYIFHHLQLKQHAFTGHITHPDSEVPMGVTGPGPGDTSQAIHPHIQTGIHICTTPFPPPQPLTHHNIDSGDHR